MVYSVIDHDYNIYVSVWHQFCGKKSKDDDTTFSTTSQFLIVPKVEITYQSDATSKKKHSSWQSFTSKVKSSTPSKIKDTHKTPKFFKFDCKKLDSEEGLISRMISDMKLPFSLDGKKVINWRVQDTPMQPKPFTQLENQEDLIKKILDLARCMRNKDQKEDMGSHTMYLNIEREVVIPQNELEAMVKDREEKELAHNIDGVAALIIDYQVLLGRNLSVTQWKRKITSELMGMNVTIDEEFLDSLVQRADKETEERILMGLKRAKLSSIRALERVEVSENDDDSGLMEECSICREEFVAGDFAKRMPSPCSHMFHEECIDKWLCKNHVCPLCRYELPTETQFA